ncbi:MAG: hypothetical protein IJX25_02440 [Clostridia bacterium]|nr:hypothetical protein [Clostridia bacterium]MBQ8793032.1 hypothetical protein [Clostridia bacterium]
MKRYTRASIAGYKSGKTFKWAFNMLIISISMSLCFGFISQTILSKMGIVIATLLICLFIGIAVVFDMLGVAAVSADIDAFALWKEQEIKGANAGFQLCLHCEKVCSFCGDVVGDICSTLCGASGACIVVALTEKLNNGYLVMLISITVSAFIAGWTIFFKALMKEYALQKSNKIILKIGLLLEKTIFKEKRKKI